MATCVTGTTPCRRMERKSDKSKRRNRNRNRKKNRNHGHNHKRNRTGNNNRIPTARQFPALKQHATEKNSPQPKEAKQPKSSVQQQNTPIIFDQPHAMEPIVLISDESSCMSDCGSLVQFPLQPGFISQVLTSTIPTHEHFSLECLTEISTFQQSLFILPDVLIQIVLSFIPIFDLSKNARPVCPQIVHITSLHNSWVAKSLEPQIAPTKKCDEEKTWTYENKASACKKVVLFVGKTQCFGSELQRAACKMKRRGPIDDHLFFECATAVFHHRSGVCVNQPGWHEVTMSCSHGMEALSDDYLTLYLKSKGMKEDDLTEENRIELRRDFLGYMKKLRKDGARTISLETRSYILEKMDDYDLESIQDRLHELEEEKKEMEDDSDDQQYPLCQLAMGAADARCCVDPLSSMSFLRNGEMARRIVRLLIDLKNRVPEESISQCVRVTWYYIQAVINRCGSRADVETMQSIILNVFGNEPMKSRLCSLLLRNLTGQLKRKNLEATAEWMIEVHGYDVRFDYDVWARERTEFAEEMIPFLVSKIEDVDNMAPGVTDTLVQFVQSKVNPAIENVSLKNRVKELVYHFVSQFI